MLKIRLGCPSCAAPVPQQAQRHMNGFWGPRPIQCVGCGQSLQYHSSLLPRLRIGGHIFRSGLLIIALWLIMKVLGVLPAASLAIIGWIGLSFTVVGILVTATRRVCVEAVSDT